MKYWVFCDGDCSNTNGATSLQEAVSEAIDYWDTRDVESFTVIKGEEIQFTYKFVVAEKVQVKEKR